MFIYMLIYTVQMNIIKLVTEIKETKTKQTKKTTKCFANCNNLIQSCDRL